MNFDTDLSALLIYRDMVNILCKTLAFIFCIFSLRMFFNHILKVSSSEDNENVYWTIKLKKKPYTQN